MFASPSPLERALANVAIPYLWSLFGLPGKPGVSCRSPFREDRHPSFSVYDDGWRWYDFKTGEGGDAADFVAKALNLSREDGCRKLIEIAGTGGKSEPQPTPASQLPRPAAKPDPLLDKKKAFLRRTWPAFEPPSRAEIAAIATQRGLSLEGVAIAAARGLLFCATWHEHRAWVVSDSSRLNAQARRLDGQRWKEKDIDSKAWTLPGSMAGWPASLREAHAFPAIALCEGGPDLLAAFHLAWCETATPETLARGKGVDVLGNLGVCAFFGAKLTIIAAALPLFAGKRIRIFAHDDVDGYDGTATWATALEAAGATVDGFGFSGFHQDSGAAVNDLNDFAHIDPDEWEAERGLIGSAFSFVQTPEPSNLKRKLGAVA